MWAAKTRTDEEVNLLYAEARATRRGFLFAGEVHLTHATALPEYASRGASAWAKEKGAMFKRMAEDCWNIVEEVHKGHTQLKWDGDEELGDVRDVYLTHLCTLTMEDLDHSLVCV